MHGGVNAAGVRRFTGIAKVAHRIPAGKIGFGVETAYGVAGDGGEFFLALRTFFESGIEGVFFPGFERGVIEIGGGLGNFCFGGVPHREALPERESAHRLRDRDKKILSRSTQKLMLCERSGRGKGGELRKDKRFNTELERRRRRDRRETPRAYAVVGRRNG